MSTTNRCATLVVWNLTDGPYLQRTAGVCGNAMCIRDTRLTVYGLVEWQRFGLSDAELLAAFPELTAEDLAMAWDYARRYPGEIDREIRENRGDS